MGLAKAAVEARTARKQFEMIFIVKEGVAVAIVIRGAGPYFSAS